jgi:tripeptide aminopeptidase
MNEVFFRLLEAESPSGFEKKAADIICGFLDKQGIRWKDDGTAIKTGSNVGNIIVAGSGQARLSFCAHFDTIRIFEKKKPCCEGTIVKAQDGGVLGIDGKSGVALLLELAASLHENGGIPEDIHFLFTAHEESGFKGAWELDPRHFCGAYTFVLDSGGIPLVRVVSRAVGQISYAITVHGVMGHASSHGTKNAALFSAQLIPLLKPGKAEDESFIHVGSIECPGNPNTIPDSSVISGQILSYNKKESEKILIDMKTTVENLAREQDFSADFKVQYDCDPWAVPDDDPIINYARDAAAKTGLPFTLGQSWSGSDAQVLAQRGGKVIKISTGMMAPHSKEEHIDLEDMKKCADYLWRLAVP